jgi:hypothetical protein
MSAQISSVLTGAVAMASLVAALFFAKFWRRTGDAFFALFAAAFAIDGIARFLVGIVDFSSEAEPLAYLPRLLTFGLIVIAIVQKNLSGPMRK